MKKPNNISTEQILNYIIEHKILYRKDIKKIFNISSTLDKLFNDLIDSNIILKKKEKRLIVYSLTDDYLKKNQNIIPNTIIDEYFVKSNDSKIDYISKFEFRRRQKNEFKEFYYLLMENYDCLDNYDLNITNLPFIRKFAIIDNFIYVLYYNYPIELVAKIKAFKL